MEPGDATDPSIVETLDDQVNQFMGLLPNLVVAFGVLVLFTFIGWLLGRLVRLALIRRGDRIHAALLGRMPTWIFAAVGLIVATDYLGLEGLATGLLAGGGATAIILGFAFREVGENFLAGIFLVFSRPFRVGDLIQSGELSEGSVKSVDLRNTHIRTTDGRDIFIPNAHVFNRPLVNFTRDGLRRPTFTVGVDYHDPIEEVRAAILEAVCRVEGVLKSPAPRVNIIQFPSAYVLLEVTIWIDTFSGTDFAQARTAAMEACRRAIIDNNWTISADSRTAVQIFRAPD